MNFGVRVGAFKTRLRLADLQLVFLLLLDIALILIRLLNLLDFLKTQNKYILKLSTFTNIETATWMTSVGH